MGTMLMLRRGGAEYRKRTFRWCSGMAAVTRENFGAALEKLKVDLKAADFVAIDMEMSGVNSAPWRRGMQLDTLETRYQNLRDSAEKFLVFQCGVCLFRYDKPSSKFIAYPYNFYLFPRNELPIDSPPPDFLCQTSSLNFLAQHLFDFNTCIYNGISYLSKQQELSARRLMEKKYSEENEESTATFAAPKTSDVLFCERVKLEVGLWRTAKIMVKSKSPSPSPSPAMDAAALVNTLPCLLVNISDGRQAKLVVEAINSNFADLVSVIEHTGGSDGRSKRVKVLFLRNKEHKSLVEGYLQISKREMIEGSIREAVGFRHVIDALSQSQKPIVGHNCILDFAHIHSKFIAPLPPKYSDFCAAINELFPCVMDTKYLLKIVPEVREAAGNISTTLSNAYSFFFGPLPNKVSKSGSFTRVGVEVANEFQSYVGTEFKHEAGFDAYMTGAIFAQMWRLAENGKEGLSKHANLLYLGWAGHMVLDLSSGEGRKEGNIRMLDSRAAVLVWKEEERLECLREVKEVVKGCLDVIRVDEKSAFVVFKSLYDMEEFMSEKRGSVGVGGLKIARFERYERLCKSSITNASLADSIQMLNDQYDDNDDVVNY